MTQDELLQLAMAQGLTRDQVITALSELIESNGALASHGDGGRDIAQKLMRSWNEHEGALALAARGVAA